jgi:hypothetical protein
VPRLNGFEFMQQPGRGKNHRTEKLWRKFQIENSFPNDGYVEPDFEPMSQKLYCAT